MSHISTAQQRIQSLIDAAKAIGRVDLERERELMNRKWFEYRFMSPWTATLLFGRKYKEAFRASFRQCLDRDRAAKVRGTSLSRFQIEPRELTQMWKARQRADAVGMRYEEYLHAALDFATRRQRRMLPRPNQLHHTPRSKEAWEAHVFRYWNECLGAGLAQVGNHVGFRMEKYEHLPAQDAYREFILGRTASMSQPLYRVMRAYSYERCQIPAELFKALVPEEQFRREVDLLKDDYHRSPWRKEPLPAAGPDALWQSCFGVPHARDTASATCSRCPQSKQCAYVAGVVLDRVKASCGTTDPIGDRQREAIRVRQARSRKRKKEAAQSQTNLPAEPAETAHGSAGSA